MSAADGKQSFAVTEACTLEFDISKIMQNTFFLSVFFSLSSTIQTGLLASYCNDIKYRTINDARRSTAFNTTSARSTPPPVPCDKIIHDNVWYRFTSEAGGEMPTTKPELRRCGTNVPIWMNGTHPTVKEGIVKRKVCAGIPHMPPDGCGYSYTIQVRNCSGFYIYQLKKPEKCFLSYCAGSKLLNCTNASPEDYCLENSPPNINMPDRLYAFENSEFQLFFNATDREAYPLQYGFDRPNTTTGNVSIDQENKLITISPIKSGSVVLIVKEHVRNGLKSYHTIKVDVVSCPCRNGGKCHRHNSVSTKREDLSYTCDCVKPYAGKVCEISPCDKSPCFPGLKCFVTHDSYICESCPVMFKGDGKECHRVPTRDPFRVEAELTIDSGLEWNVDLLNKTSFFYRKQTAEIVAQITQAYKNTEQFLYVDLIAYRKGSVVVEFEVVMKTKVDDPLKQFKKYLQDNNGTLGKFKVQPNSVVEKTSPTVGQETYFGIHKTIFIVVVCFVSILLFTFIVVCGICIKKKHVSIIMLTMNEDRREIFQTNGNEQPRPHNKRPSSNQVMDLFSIERKSS